MVPKIKQYFDIKFPFTDNNDDGFFIDLNTSVDSKVASQIAHVILTQKGTRLRMPQFGTDLIKFIFDRNDNMVWSEVENEIRKQVSSFVPNVDIKDIVVIQGEKDDTIMVDIKYSVKRGNSTNNYRMALKL